MDTPQQTPGLQQPTPSVTQRKVSFVNIILAIFCIFVIGEVIYLSYLRFRVAKMTPTTPAVTTAPQKAYWDTFEETCGLKQEENPLVNALSKGDDYATGSVRGNIEKIDYIEAAGQASVRLRSADGKQGHDFILDEVPNLVYENGQATTIRSLQPGQEITISFQCEKRTNYAFDITRVKILTKRPLKGAE